MSGLFRMAHCGRESAQVVATTCHPDRFATFPETEFMETCRVQLRLFAPVATQCCSVDFFAVVLVGLWAMLVVSLSADFVGLEV